MRLTQRSFTAGEVSPSVGARADLDWYSAALSECKNAYVRSQGGVYNREGTLYIDESRSYNDDEVRLIPFSFNKDQSYILVLTRKVIEIVYKDSFIHLPGTTDRLHIVTPFENIWNISRSGFADTMTMVDGVVAPQVLKRYSHTDWRISAIDFSVSTEKPNSLSITRANEESGSKDYSYAVTAIGLDDVESLAKEGRISTKPITSEQQMVITVGLFPKDKVESYNIYKSISPGSKIYGFIGSCKNDFPGGHGNFSGKFNDYNYEPDLLLSPPLDNKPFEQVNDRPRSCSFYQQRRIFASTNNDPQKIFCTEIGNISSMRYSKPSKPTDAIIQEVVSNSINRIRHILNLGGLLLLTSEGEMKVTAGQDSVLTPATFGAKVISSYGSSNVVPAQVRDTTIFSQEQGARLIGLNLDNQSTSVNSDIIGNDLSIRAEHIFQGKKIVDMSYCKEPYNILWCVLDDGTMAGLTYNREHRVWGFHRHETQGKYRTVATISNGNTSSTYMVVERNANGVTKHYVERMVEREDTNLVDCFFLDSGKTYRSQTPITVLTGLTYLNGLVVSILADGNVISGKVVSGGSVTLDFPAKVIHVGLPYVTELTTLEIDSARNTMKGRKKNVNSIVFGLYQTRGVKAGQSGQPLVELKERTDDKESISLKTGDANLVIKRGWENSGKIKILHDDPLPFGLISITPEFGVE
ncbi:hypothetical protein BJAS_P3432 [Bathymodiolus japonicus methanotrophic gill symbiont]|uniref:hypothetical protein n=1 Tax=Bathymodiolus japonicus methanotrophic gill symbiont TaxID=113269 RepID=UPI001B7072ED|nr:hypothetical protein [Bathymodiolus japonicus methanotrophic gill symbiont]GFO72896.1 hypothetical protein BJAS_P3432 [Bathymodiolus japonicus methanotrophic gill symbiont]